MLDLLKLYLASIPIPALSGTTIFALVLVALTAIIFSSLSAATSTITIHKKLIGHHLGHGLEEGDALDVSDFEPEDLDDEGRPRPPASVRSPSVIRITSSDPSSPLCLDPIRIIDDGSGISGNRIILPPPAPEAAPPKPTLLSPIITQDAGSITSSIAGSDSSSIAGSDSVQRKKHIANRRFSAQSPILLARRNSQLDSGRSGAAAGKKRPDSIARRASKRNSSSTQGFGDASPTSPELRNSSRSPSPSALSPNMATEAASESGNSSPLDPFFSPASSDADGSWHDADEDEDSDEERALVDATIGAGILNTPAGAIIEEEPSSPITAETPELPVTDAAPSLPKEVGSPPSPSSAPSTPSPTLLPISPNARARRAAASIQAWHDSPPAAVSGATGSKKKNRSPPNAPLPATPTSPTLSSTGPLKGRMMSDYHSSSDTESVGRFAALSHKRSTPPSILRRQPQPFRSALLPLPSKGRALKAARFLSFPPELEKQWQAQVQRAQIQQALLNRQHLHQQQQLLSGPAPVSQQQQQQQQQQQDLAQTASSADSSLTSKSSESGNVSTAESAAPTPPAKDDPSQVLGRHVRAPPPTPLNTSIINNTSIVNNTPWTPVSPWVDTPSGSASLQQQQQAGVPRTAAIGPMKRKRTIVVREPDWTPYALSHARAREREEMRSRTLIARRASVSSSVSSSSSSVGPTAPLANARSEGRDSSSSRRRKRKSIGSLLGGVMAPSSSSSEGGIRSGAEETEVGGGGGDEMAWEEEESGEALADGNVLGVSIPIVRVENDSTDGAEVDDDQEFWFERFTRSTAAAGKDWDWRKRRARVLIPSPPPPPSDTSAAGGKGSKADGPLPPLPGAAAGGSRARPSNVGKDAVDIVHEDRSLLNVPSDGSKSTSEGSENGGHVTKRLISPRASPRKASLPLSAGKSEETVNGGGKEVGSAGEAVVPMLVFKANGSGSQAASDAGSSSSSSSSNVVRFPQGSPEATRSGSCAAGSGDSAQGSPSSSPKSSRRLALASLTRSDHGSGSGSGPPSPTSGRPSLRSKMAMRLSAWTSGDAPVLLPGEGGGGGDGSADVPQEDRQRRMSTDSDLGQKRGLDLASAERFKIARRRTSSEGRVLQLGGNEREELEGYEEEDNPPAFSGGGALFRKGWRKKSDASVPARLSSLTSSKDRPSGSGASSRSQRQKRHTSFGSLLGDDERVQRLLAEAEVLSSDEDSILGRVGSKEAQQPLSSGLLSSSNTPSTPSIVLNGHHRTEDGGQPRITLLSSSPSTASSTLSTKSSSNALSAAPSTLHHHPPALEVFRAPAGVPLASPRTTSMPKSAGRPRVSDPGQQTLTTVRTSRSRRTSDASSSASTSASLQQQRQGSSSSSSVTGSSLAKKASSGSLSSRSKILSDAKSAQIVPAFHSSAYAIRSSSGVPNAGYIGGGGGGNGSGFFTPERNPVLSSPFGALGSASSSSNDSDLAALPRSASPAWGDLGLRLPHRSSNGSMNSTYSSSNGSLSGAPGSALYVPAPTSSSSSRSRTKGSAASFLPSSSSSSSSSSSISMPSSPTTDGPLKHRSGRTSPARHSSPSLGGTTTAASREQEYRRTSTGLVQSDLVRHFSRTDPQSMSPRP